MVNKKQCLEFLFTEINILTECRHPNVVKILDASFDGTITLVTAATRIVIALAITTGIVAMVGSLFDSYQGQAAVKTVQDAVIEARKKADELAAAEVAMGDGVGTTAGRPDGGVIDER